MLYFYIQIYCKHSSLCPSRLKHLLFQFFKNLIFQFSFQLQLLDHNKRVEEDEERSLRRSTMAASHSSVAVSSSGIGSGGHMLATSSSMGNVYNGNTHANRDFLNHETLSNAALSPTSSNANHKNIGNSGSSSSGMGVSGNSGGGIGNRIITTNSPCLNNFLFPILNDVSVWVYLP